MANIFIRRVEKSPLNILFQNICHCELCDTFSESITADFNENDWFIGDLQIVECMERKIEYHAIYFPYPNGGYVDFIIPW